MLPPEVCLSRRASGGSRPPVTPPPPLPPVYSIPRTWLGANNECADDDERSKGEENKERDLEVKVPPPSIFSAVTFQYIPEERSWARIQSAARRPRLDNRGLIGRPPLSFLH